MTTMSFRIDMFECNLMIFSLSISKFIIFIMTYDRTQVQLSKVE